MNSMLSEEVTGTPRQYGYIKLLSFYMLSLRIGFVLNVLLWRVSNIFDIPGLEYSLYIRMAHPRFLFYRE